jgi:hypothetical protein
MFLGHFKVSNDALWATNPGPADKRLQGWPPTGQNMGGLGEALKHRASSLQIWTLSGQLCSGFPMALDVHLGMDP